MGYRLHRASEIPNFALSPAIRISIAWRISVPPAIATPSTAAMSGFEGLYDRKRPFQWISGSSLDLALISTPVSASSASPDIAFRSAPEVKLPSAPVTITQRISSFADASTKASYIRTIIGPDIAFIRLGLFKVTVIM